jgi:hypothetical protein
MKCDRHSQKIADYVRGVLPNDNVEELEAHMSTCERCRTELDDLRWFLTGVKNNQAAVQEGHLSSRLLYEYVDDSSILDRDTIARIENHLGTCESCRQDLDQIAELIALELSSGETAAGTTTHGTRWFSRPRMRRVFAGLASVLVIASFVWVFVTLTGKPDYVVSLVSDPGELHTVDMTLSDLVRGEPDTTPVVRLGEIEQRKIVLRIEVDVFEGEEPPATVSFSDAAFQVVWTAQLEKRHADTGTILLLVDKSTFVRGLYTVEVLNRYGTSLGRCVIRF